MRPQLPSSITLRLSLLFALTLLVLALGAGAYLYHALLLELTSRDENELRSKVMTARDVVAATPTVAALNDRGRLGEIIAGHERLSLYVLAGGQLAYTTGTPGPPADLIRLPAATEPTLVTSRGGLARAIVVNTTVADGSPAEIVLEFDANATQQLLDSHLRQIAVVVVLSALLGLAAAYAIARSGLRPLRTMAGTARRISVDQLAERLSVTEAPSELRELAGAFNAMLDRLQDSFTRLNEYSSDLAHEMRTPINNLIGQTQVVLTRSRSHDEYRMALESNMEEFERLSRMVGDMLFIARAENPQTHVTRRPVDLRAVATKMQHFYEPIMAEKDVRLDVEGQATISGDSLIVERAVSNLVSNAVRHADAGTTIQLRIARTADATTFEVLNRGPPIAPELADRLFNRFARGAASDGLGLGLALVQSVMRLHHGSVEVSAESAERVVRFVLNFPDEATVAGPFRERRSAS